MSNSTRYAVQCDRMTTNERLAGQIKDGVVVYDTDLNAYYKVVGGAWVEEPVDANDIGTGWAQYSDTVYTSGSPLLVTQGTEVALTNNAGSTITSNLPTGVTAFYDGTTNLITPENSGDAYMLRVDFSAWNTVTEGYGVVKLDIGGGIGVILNRSVQFPRGSGSGNVRLFTSSSLIYTLGTFIANGGTLTFESVRGNTSIYDINFVISRVHKA